MLSLLVALALAASTPSSFGKDGTPISGTFQGLITADDYPADAAKKGQEGSVVIRLTVNEEGAVADCEVIKSSGVPSLDTQTCRIAWQRARFTPGTDKNGRPRGGSTVATITWRLENPKPLPSEPWAKREIVELGDDGKPAPCRIEREGVRVDPPSESKSECDEKLEGTLWVMKAARPGVSAVVLEQRFSLGSLGGFSAGPDRLVVARQVALMEIDALGKVKSCTIADPVGPVQANDLCTYVAKYSFAPRAGSDGKPASFKATYLYQAFAKVQNAASAAPSGSSRKP